MGTADAAELVQVGSFASPVHVTGPPADPSRLLVVERSGTIRLLRDGAAVATPFLDQAAITRTDGSEEGLLSVALAPDFAGSRRLWVYYVNRSGDLQIDALRAPSGDAADPASRQVVTTIAHPFEGNHNGGLLRFGPDGALYAGTGDGGGGGDPDGSAQDPASRLGKILRFDVSVQPAAITTYASGLRNPWRFTFAPDGALVIGDVGQGAIEEVSVVRGGGGAVPNLGWNAFEGTGAFAGGGPLRGGPHVPPVIEQRHDDGWCSITGGVFGRQGYLYGDFCKGEILVGDLTTGRSVPAGLPRVEQLSTFGNDGCGRAYAASLAGPVFRVEDGTVCPPPAALPGAAAGPAPGAAAPAVDRSAPRVRLSRTARTQRPLSSGRIRVRLSCDEDCRVDLSGRLLERSTSRLPGRRLAANAAVTLDLRLPKATRSALGRALRRGVKPRVRVAVRASDAAGNRRSTSLRIALRR